MREPIPVRQRRNATVFLKPFLWVIEMNIKRYEVRGGRSGMEEAGGPVKADRQVVLLSDHIASHSYDEAKERELFEAFWSENMSLLEMDLHRHIYPMNSGWSYACHETNRSWMTWKACAKSRAGIQS